MFENYPDVVNVSELSEMLGICEKTAYILLKNNKIKYRANRYILLVFPQVM